MSVLVLRWRRPAPLVQTAWRGPDARVMAQAALSPPGPVAALVGPPGPAGGGASATIVHTAGEGIGGHRVVRIAAGEAHIASPADTDIDATIGVTTGATITGAAATIQIAGELTEAGWAWAPGPVWLGANGIPTQTVPTSGALYRVGTATGPTTIIINPRLIARL